MTLRKGDAITWTSYYYPSKIIDGSRTYDYSYDASRQKWEQVYTIGSVTETTYFGGRIFEKNINSSDTEHRHHIMANGKAVALFIERMSGSDYLRYLTRDHLGSVDGIIQNTWQLRDFAEYASRNNLRFDLFVRPDTILSRPLLEAFRSAVLRILPIPGI